MEFGIFVREVTGFDPYPYQEKVGTTLVSNWPDVLEVPTGLGKTEAVTLGWAWQFLKNPDITPRRLVYMLPMRVLVEQTYDRVDNYINKINLMMSEGRLPGVKKPPKPFRVFKLMGGAVDQAFDTDPVSPMVIVGTQDMILSRQLNRGFSMSPYRWPVDFALLNNDVLVVADETQLMGIGMTTARELQRIRNEVGTYGITKTVFMTATPPRSIMEQNVGEVWRLQEADRRDERVRQRISASKKLTIYGEGLEEYMKQPELPADKLILVVVNTVGAAQEIYKRIKKNSNKSVSDGGLFGGIEGPEILLLHSRFRPVEREEKLRRLKAMMEAGRGIVVATQVIEAGVDLDADVLVTELAPWPSMVQRFGRVNRKGTKGTAEIRVFIPEGMDKKQEFVGPYSKNDLIKSLDLLRKLEDFGSAGISSISAVDRREILNALPDEEVGYRLIVHDVYELFDTEPDINGFTSDVSRFIRIIEEPSVGVIWRDFDQDKGPEVEKSNRKKKHRPWSRDEVCQVPLSQVRAIVKDKDITVWVWDFGEGEWVYAQNDNVYPGTVMMLHSDDGMYDAELGWYPKNKGTGKKKAYVKPVPRDVRNSSSDTGMGSDSGAGREVLLREHLFHVTEKLRATVELLGHLMADPYVAEALEKAAMWHDVGKAHQVFQKAVGGNKDGLLAKSSVKSIRYERNYFRHEVPSMMAWLLEGPDDMPRPIQDLVAYLILSHHGKVRMRLSRFRGEEDTLRGIKENDRLPPVELPDGTVTGEVELDLEIARLGYSQRWGASWLDRTARLLGSPEMKRKSGYGPFRLAFMEAVLRASDWQASAEERNEGGDER